MSLSKINSQYLGIINIVKFGFRIKPGLMF